MKQITQAQEHTLVTAIADAAVEAGFEPGSKKFRGFYQSVERIVRSYDQERSRLLEMYFQNAVNQAMVATPTIVIHKEALPK